jgi:hypothetical protein
MATGGIFQLITNDGKQDRMLMATALLNKRLLEIERMRARNPQIKDPTPTLVDIERTHILFMNAHFKPFAAIGYEYNKVQVQSGAARLGAEVQFSIPQFGDFFNDMVLHLKLSSVTASNSAYWTDPAASPAVGSELLRYVDFLGQRLVKRVRFQVNGNPLDEYDSDVYNMHQKFFVTPNKQVGWNRAVAQEVPMQGYQHACSTEANPGESSGIRLGLQVFDGPQTPKITQPLVELWVPLIFWFNKDPRLAIPSVSIPYGQRFIDVEFAAANEILQHVGAIPELSNPATNPIAAAQTPTIDVADLYINNIFVNPEIHDIFIKRIGFSLIRVHRRQVIRTTKANDNLLLNQMKWPIETMYVGLRPVANVNVQDTKMLNAWHIYAKVDELSAKVCGNEDWLYAANIATNTLAAAWDLALGLTTFNTRVIPEALSDFLGVGASAQVTINQVNSYLSYYGLAQFDPTSFDDPDVPTVAEVNAAWPQLVQGGLCCEVDYYKCSPTMQQIAIEAHGVPLYRDLPASFFNHYIPYTYGGQHIKTPDDCGAYMITFNLYPGSYQPSGHVNVSRAREFYLAFTSVSGTVDTNNPADLVVIGIAINFLLISDGSAVLRYST